MLILRLMIRDKNAVIYQNSAAVDLLWGLERASWGGGGFFFLISLFTTNRSCFGPRKHWRCVKSPFTSVYTSPGRTAQTPHDPSSSSNRPADLSAISLMQTASLTNKDGRQGDCWGRKKKRAVAADKPGRESEGRPLAFLSRLIGGGSAVTSTVTSSTKTTGGGSDLLITCLQWRVICAITRPIKRHQGGKTQVHYL